MMEILQKNKSTDLKNKEIKKSVEKINVPTIHLEDNRDPKIRSDFDINFLMDDIKKFISPSSFKESLGSKKYGQLLTIFTSESDLLKECLLDSKSIYITVTNTGENIHEKLRDRTTVTLYCLKDDKSGVKINMYFNQDGTFHNFGQHFYQKIEENKPLDTNKIKEIK